MDNNIKSRAILESLEDFIIALSEGERSSYNQIIHSIKFKANIFEKYTSWSAEHYTRNCIVDSEKFELILICWDAGQATPIHDHGGEECWVKVIQGEFKETIYKENEAGALHVVKTAVSRPNEVTYMKGFMGFHAFENVSNKKSMSLHLYAKPIRKCRIFHTESKTFLQKELHYDTKKS